MKRFRKFVVLIVLLVLAPIVHWYLTVDESTLNVSIIDKTVINESYQEHLGITWLLNHERYKKSDQTAYSAEDFYGFDMAGGDYQVKNLPSDYSDSDLIYISDTYGVYQSDEIDLSPQDSEFGLVYGGISLNEWSNIKKRLNDERPVTLVCEYNTFAAPTGSEVRKNITSELGVSWSGWIGRYYNELNPQKNGDIPNWLIEAHSGDWDYEGAGLVFFHEGDNSCLVFQDELSEEGVTVKASPAGEELWGELSDKNFYQWFDLVEVTDTGQALAYYDFGLSSEGLEKLKEAGIPTEAVAVSYRENNQSKMYYLAGNFSHLTKMPSFYQASGLVEFYQLFEQADQASFYWNVYQPIMSQILETKDHSEIGEIMPEKENTEKENTEKENKFKVTKDSFQVLQDGKWESITVKGVNMGMASPGHFPGEAAITEDNYLSWFKKIGEMNANVVRNYTLHPPEFYRALLTYNQSHPDKPIYLLHGSWLDEALMDETGDVYDEEIAAEFDREHQQIVDAIHGQAVVEERPGHAHGIYDSDVSDYVIGWIIGIEWNPDVVEETNNIHAGQADYKGKFIQANGASPFENWLAGEMDKLLTYEMDKYSVLRPVSFTNWVTTDPIDHPSDSTDLEDKASVDPDKIAVINEAAETGMFASYHIYPYYPDFLNYDQNYQYYIDHRGEYNNYAGYLDEITKHTKLPILVAEYGLPASRGRAHSNIYGLHQGGLNEAQQGKMVVQMYEDICQADTLGGVVFSWKDEWFKRTWNTMDYDNPDRRPFWYNVQSSEQAYGIMGFSSEKITVDGSTDDWEGIAPLVEKDGVQLSVTQDESYLYLLIEDKSDESSAPVIVFDTVPGQGNTGLEGVDLGSGAEFVVDFSSDEVRLMVDEYYDVFSYHYGVEHDYVENVSDPVKDSGNFNPIYYALNRPYYIKDRDILLDFEYIETGLLTEGTSDRNSPDFNSMTDYARSKDGKVTEIRLPWLLLSARDPSRKEFMADIHSGQGSEASVTVDSIGIGLLMRSETGTLEAISSDESGVYQPHSWENWDLLDEYNEYLKPIYYDLQKAYSK